MEDKYKILEKIKEERKKIINRALGINLTGARMPSDYALELAKDYIDGKIEIEELQKKILDKYKK